MSFIGFDKVYKIYPSGVKALQNVSFSIEEGEFVFLVGPTGAGKTTLMKLINREELPTSGNIWFDDIRINHLDDGYLPFLQMSRFHIPFGHYTIYHYTVMNVIILIPISLLKPSIQI